MATTKDRLDQLTRHPPQANDHRARMPEDVGVATPRGQARPAAAMIHRPATAAVHTPIGVRLLEPISTRWALIAGVAWVVLLTLVLGALLTTLAGLGMRRRWGLAASLVAAGMLVLSTVMCPVSGHHTGVGGWWVVQLGCGLGLVATSILAWRRATPQ
jgi:hypothetical protein